MFLRPGAALFSLIGGIRRSAVILRWRKLRPRPAVALIGQTMLKQDQAADEIALQRTLGLPVALAADLFAQPKGFDQLRAIVNRQVGVPARLAQVAVRQAAQSRFVVGLGQARPS